MGHAKSISTISSTLFLLVLGCGPGGDKRLVSADPPGAPGAPGSGVATKTEDLISDQQHLGRRGFYFVSPFAAATAREGTFLMGRAPVVRIDVIQSSRFQIPPGNPLNVWTTTANEADDYLDYWVYWDVGPLAPQLGEIYRVSVLLDGRLLGYADVSVLQDANGLGMANIDDNMWLTHFATSTGVWIKFYMNPCATVDCAASDQCHAVGICDANSGICSNPARPDGSICDDGNPCTTVDTCRAGVCTGGGPVACTRPISSFRTASGLPVSTYEDGARVAYATSSQGPSALPEFAIYAVSPVSSGWTTAQGQSTDQRLIVRLIGPDRQVVDRVLIRGDSRADGIADFSIAVSTTSSRAQDMRTVFEGTVPNDDLTHQYHFAPVQARYVQLRALNNYGSSVLSVAHFEVQTQPREGGIVSLLEGGASIVRATSAPDSAAGAIDFTQGPSWYATGPFPQSIRIALTGSGDMVDRVRLLGGWGGGGAIRRFEVRVSNTTPDDGQFTTVLSGMLPAAYQYHWFTFPPVPARYVELALLDNQSQGVYPGVWVDEFRVYAQGIGARTVPFEDFSSSPNGGITAWNWSFGDGTTSTAQHPTHIFAPGTYAVRMTVTDAIGFTSTSTLTYTALASPTADFFWNPLTPNESDTVYFTDRSSTPAAAIVQRSWDSGAAWAPMGVGGTMAQATYQDNGLYPVTLSIVDSNLLTARILQTVELRNLPPGVSAGPDPAIVWGQPWTSGLNVVDPSPIDQLARLFCTWDWGDGTRTFVERCAGIGGRVPKTYAAPGTYIATVAATDKDWGTGSDSVTVRVGRRESATLIVGAIAADPSGNVQLRVRLVDRFDSTVPIAGRSIVVSSSGGSTTVVTGALGDAVATLLLPANTANTVVAQFGGDTYYQGSTSSATFDPAAPGAIPQLGYPPTNGNRGREFVLGFTENGSWTAPSLMVMSTVPNVVTIESPALSAPRIREILPNTLVSIDLPLATLMLGSNTVQRNGVRVTSEQPITLYGAQWAFADSDVYLAIPTPALGTDYVVPAYGSTNAGPPEVGIVATQDNTTVTIRPTGPVSSPDHIYPRPGVPFTVRLNRLETFPIQSFTTSSTVPADLTGTEVTSDRPIAVFGGNRCAFVPTSIGTCNHLIEQIPPTPTWGRRFVTVPLALRRAGDIFRILPAQNATQIRINGVLAATLNRGQFLERDVPSNVYQYIETSGPSLVVQYQKGVTAEIPLGLGYGYGDPTMMIVPPIEQFGTGYVLSTPADATPPNQVWTRYVNIAAPTAQLNGIRIDGAPITTAWTPIGASGLSGTQLPITYGVHRIWHVSPIVTFGVYSYGFGSNADAYGLPAEMRLTQLNQPCTPTPGYPGDLIDNDCDGRTDEELANQIDDDGDGRIDEDLAAGEVGNIQPIANSFQRPVDQGRTVALVFTASNRNAAPLTYDIVSQPTHGTLLTFDPTNPSPPPLTSFTNLGPVVVYQANDLYQGPDRVLYVARDPVRGLTSNTATITLTVLPVEHPPVITSSPPISATEGQLYTYTLTARDLDPGDTLTYFMSSGPTGMTIDAASGVVRWTPVEAHVGPNAVTLGVRDIAGVTRIQTFTINVINVNDPPSITSAPVTSANQLVPYAYQVTATDPDRGDIIRFSLDAAPSGMRIDPVSGLVGWTPVNQSGPYSVTVRVTDLGGLFATQSFTVTVVVDTIPPRVAVSAAPSIVSPNQSTVITLVATDNVGVVSRSLTVNGAAVSIDANGRATYSAAAPGSYAVAASASDAAGNVGRATTQFAVRDPSVTSAPIALIGNPTTNAIVTAPMTITGTVSDANLVLYELGLARGENDPFTRIGGGVSSVLNGALGTLDPTLLENGIYRLRLYATNTAGNTAESIVPIQIQGGMKIGAVTLSFVDLGIPLSGIPITVTRSYDSRVKTSGDFGYGWRLAVSAGRYEHSRRPGDGWEFPERDPSNPFSLPCISGPVRELRPHRTEVRLSSREVYTFLINFANPQRVASGCEGDAGFMQIGGLPGASLAIVGNRHVTFQFGTDVIRDATTFETYNPLQVELTTPDGRIIDLDRNLGITRIQDLNGNSLSINGNGIVHSSGRSVTFTRDAQNRITRITDPLGNTLDYLYDTRGDLVAFIDQTHARTDFAYDLRHNMTDMQNALGLHALRNDYDDDGRLVTMYDSHGNRVTLTHDIVNHTETTSDPLGNATTWVYDPRGNVLRRTDALNRSWTYTYDSNDNQLSATDPLSRVSTTTYDANGNVASYTSYDGDTTLYVRNPRGQVLTSTDARGRVINHRYDPTGNLLSTTDGTRATTTFTYTSSGNLSSSTDPLGHMTTVAYDTFGNVTQITNALRRTTNYGYDGLNRRTSVTSTRTLPGGASETITTQYSYDARGLETLSIDPYGNRTATTYNALGKVLTTTDKNGTVTTYTTSDLGMPSRVDYPDGSFALFSYDAVGNLVTAQDRGGEITSYRYDPVGRRTRVTHSDQSYQETTYDEIGRVRTKRDENGSVTTFAYARHQQTITDALQHATIYFLNPDEQPERIIDPLSHGTRYTYDLSSISNAGHLIRVDFADGSFSSYRYDGAGRKITATDQENRTTQFGYDNINQLVSVTDALGNVTRYGYDEAGNTTSISDALQRVTRFEYDRLGRLTRRTLPLGQYESFAYDLMDNIQAQVDFNGNSTNYVYDAQGRMISRTLPGQNPENFSYGFRGERLMAGNETFRYDSRRHLISDIKPTGDTLNYTYDAVGNRSSIVGPHGTTRYTFDPLNRVSTVIGPDSDVATYGYDAAGDLTSVALPGGIVTSITYDSLNHRVGMLVRDAGQRTLASYAYAPSPTGRQQSIVEQPANRAVTYNYDVTYRLLSEAITDPAHGNRSISYLYDAVGNRVLRRDTLTGTTSYAYDTNDRLLSETSAGVTTSYGYDSRGSLTSKSSPTQHWTYTYEGRNLLASASNPPNVYSYEYDVDGARTGRFVNGARTNFLVDKNWVNAVVLRETNANGAETARYVVGRDEVLSSVKPAQGSRYMLYDAQRSVRQLANGGTVVDAYAYDAWGNSLFASGSSSNAYRYSGEQFDDELGTIYLRARHFDPRTGRFEGLDPAPGDRELPSTLHRYLYASNDPLDFRDPSGELSADLGEVEVSLGIQTELVTVTTISLYSIVKAVVRAAVEESVRLCVLAGEKCEQLFFRLPIIYYGGTHGEVRDHVEDAQLEGKPVILTHSFWGHSRGWWKAGIRQPNACSGMNSSLQDCDEYPMSSTEQGGRENYDAGGVSLRAVNLSVNRSAGTLLKNFYRRCGWELLHWSENFAVVALPGGAPSGYDCGKPLFP